MSCDLRFLELFLVITGLLYTVCCGVVNNTWNILDGYKEDKCHTVHLIAYSVKPLRPNWISEFDTFYYRVYSKLVKSAPALKHLQLCFLS